MARKHGKGQGGGPTRAIEELTAAGAPFTVHEYQHDPAARAFGEETVEKLGIDPAQAFKTLMVRLEPTGEFAVGCVPALARLSMKLIARAAGAKHAEMADPAVAQRRTGYVVGGISPLGQTTRHRTFIDESCLTRPWSCRAAGAGCPWNSAPSTWRSWRAPRSSPCAPSRTRAPWARSHISLRVRPAAP